MKKYYSLPCLCLTLIISACSYPPPSGTLIGYVPDAENIFYTNNGRLFVTGSRTLSEIIFDGQGGYNIQLVAESDCAHTGIAEAHGWLFTNCSITFGEQRLVAFDLNNNLNRVEVGTLPGLFIANGLVTLPNKTELLAADSNYLGQGSIAKITLSLINNTPVISGYDKDWLSAQNGINLPNGIRIKDNYLYVTNSPSVLRYLITDDGIPLTSEVLYEQSGFVVFDDLLPYCDGVIFTDFLAGQLVFIDQYNNITRSDRAFASPSALVQSQLPLFPNNQLIVTEKGLILETESTNGNRVVAVEAELVGLPSCNISF